METVHVLRKSVERELRLDFFKYHIDGDKEGCMLWELFRVLRFQRGALTGLSEVRRFDTFYQISIKIPSQPPCDSNP